MGQRTRLGKGWLKCVMAAACFGFGCDHLTATGEGQVWTIVQAAGREGPRLTLKTQTTATDSKGKSYPLEVTLSGEGGSEWGGGRQVLEMKFVAIGGPPMPEGPLMLVPDGMRRVNFGGGEPGSEMRPNPIPAAGTGGSPSGPAKPGGAVACPTLTSYGAASMISLLRGAKFVDVNVGSMTFKLDDEQVRAMAELLRRIDATVPK